MISKPIKFLSFGFLFIFLGYSGVQQYVASYFSETGNVTVGLNSLILIYLAIFLFHVPATFLISRFGIKNSLVLSSLSYPLYIFALISNSVPLIYICSFLLGIFADLLWQSQTIYLIANSDSKFYGANSGFFRTLFNIGAAASTFLFWFAIFILPMKTVIFYFAFLPIIGSVILLKLKNIEVFRTDNQLQLLKKSLRNPTLLRLSSIIFLITFVLGLTLTAIPFDIKNLFGLSMMGILILQFRFFPIIFSFFSGRVSDILGRKIMILASYILMLIGFTFLALGFGKIVFLLGFFILVFGYSIVQVLGAPLTADVSDHRNLKFVNLIFYLADGFGWLSSLALSRILYQSSQAAYLISIATIILSLLLLFPLLRLKIETIREKITKEVY